MPNLTIVGLEDNCHSDYQCFVFDGIKSEESPDVAEFIKRWVDEQFQWQKGTNIAHPPAEGEDYHVNVRHINAITDVSNHDVKAPHLHL
jgi:hypothetical protein